MSKKSKQVNKLPYLLVEEGIKKNQASERLRIYVENKISERSDIEMRYMKLLQDWTDSINAPMDANDGSECYMDNAIVKRIINELKTEGNDLIDERQRVYNKIMAEDGPYSRLQNPIIACKDSHKTYFEMKEEFSTIKKKRQTFEKDYTTHNEVKQHLTHQIEDLESQLSHRSRITSSRRPSTRGGTRKVDDMRNKLSSLRRQNEKEIDKIDGLEKEIHELDASTERALSELSNQLQALEELRITSIASQTQHFLDHVKQRLASQRSPGQSKFQNKHQSLEKIDGLLNVHWRDVRSNALRSERGEHFHLRELFAVKGQKQSKSSLITKALRSKASSKNRFERSSKDRNPEFSLSPRQANVVIEPIHSQISLTSSVRSASESTTSLEYSSNNVKNVAPSVIDMDHKRPPTRRSKPTPVDSQESIESVDLPPEVLCPANITRVEPNKQYTTKMRVAKRPEDSTNRPAHFTEFSQVSRFTGEESDTDDTTDFTKLRNVYVIAVVDNIVPTSGNELSFKKGQIIKQKIGRNEDGYCYGWMKTHPISKKAYGFYKHTMVKLSKTQKPL